MGFVLLPLFNGAGRRVQVLQSSKPLYRLLLKIAVGHRMSHRGNPQPFTFQNRDDPAGHRTLAGPRASRADRHHRLLGREHRGLRACQPEVRSCRHHQGGLVHERFMGDITVRKDDPLNMLGPDQAIEILFRMDRDPGRIQGAGQRRGIETVINVWNLRGGEPHDPIVRIIAKQHVEVMEISPGGSHDQYPDLVWLGAIIHDPPLTSGE